MAKEKERSRGEFKLKRKESAVFTTDAGPAECAFVPLERPHKSGSADLPEGIIHIYRDTANKQSFEELARQSKNLSPEEQLADDNGVILAVLAVPPWMTPSDFLSFVAPVSDGIAHLRIVQYVTCL